MENQNFEEFCSLPNAEETCNFVNDEVSIIYKELISLVPGISNDVDGDREDVVKHQKDKSRMHEVALKKIDSYGHQKADLGKTFSGECSQRSEPAPLARSHSSPGPIVFNLFENEKTQDGQKESKGPAEKLVEICKSDYQNNVHSRKDLNFLESEKETHCISISDNGSSSTEQSDVQRTPNNTSNISHNITVEDKYLNIFNMCRNDSPPSSPETLIRSPNKLTYQTVVPSAQTLELCRSSRNRRTKFYFPVDNSSNQDSTQPRLPISKLV